MTLQIETTLHLGEVGKRFRVEVYDLDDDGQKVAINVSSATTKELLLQKPGESTAVAKALTWYTDGSDGLAYYDTVAGDLDAAGDWIGQGHLIGPTFEWYGEKVSFPVETVLAVP